MHKTLCTSRSRRAAARRRGSATVTILVVLIALQLAISLSVMGGARDSDLGVQRLATVRSYYAAEAAVNMAIREIKYSTDVDGDGVVGGISADAVSSNDPALAGVANYTVTRAIAGSVATLTAQGRSSQTTRTIASRVSVPTSAAGLTARMWTRTAPAASTATQDYGAAPTMTATLPDINLAWQPAGTALWPGGPSTNFVGQLVGTITVPQTGSWTFSLDSDDGSCLYINGVLVVNNDYSQTMTMRSGSITLTQVRNTFEVRYYQNSGGWGLRALWQGPGVASQQVIPASAFTH